MRLFGRKVSFTKSSSIVMVQLALLLAACAALVVPAAAQTTAPYILPYTMTTYAGPYAAYILGTAATPCVGAGTVTAGVEPPYVVALTTAGDGCTIPYISIGTDPHDVRVDAAGNVYFIDNSGAGTVIHKINPITGLETVYGGGATVCTTFISGVPTATKEGDGCSTPASDGVANTSATASNFTKDGRGLGLDYAGDLYFAGYNDYYDHKITRATDLLSIVAGDGVATGTEYAPPAPGTPSPILSSTVYQSRGIGGDAFGNGYIADTGNSVIRESYNGVGAVPNVSAPVAGNVYTITALDPNGAAPATGVTYNNVAASSAQVYKPEDVQIDSNGNILIADTSNGVIRAIYMGTGTLPNVPSASLVKGNIYIIAGYLNPGTPNTYTYPTPVAPITTAVPATTVSIGSPRKFSIDKFNNLYIADSTNNVVWFVDASTGYIRLIAGNINSTETTGTPTAACTSPTSTDAVGDGCPAVYAGLYFNYGGTNTDGAASPDSLGNLYISDAEGGVAANSRIRKAISGLNFPAANVGVASTQNILMHFAAGDSPATAAPYTVKTTATDFAVTQPAACTTAADNTQDCILSATFKPSVPGYDTAILTVTSTKGAVSSFELTGTGIAPAIAFDPGDTALLNASVGATAIKNPQTVALDGAGNAYIADTGNNRVLFYNATTSATTVFAGGGVACGTATDSFGDGCSATAATLNAPRAVAIDTTGSVFIADTGNNLIRKVSANGVISLYAGGATTVCTLASNTRGDSCLGPQATFSAPAGLAADNVGNLYVSDTGNNLIREIYSNGNVITLAGGGTSCTTGNTDAVGDGCSALAASLSGPTGLAFDPTYKNLYVADTGNSFVRKIYLSPSFTVTAPKTVAASSILTNPITRVAGYGSAGSSVNANYVASLSQLNVPTGVAIGAGGTVYIADTGNNSIRMVTNAGIISTIAGITSATGGTGTVGGSATATQFNLPGGVAVTPIGTLFIADTGNSRLLTDSRNQVNYNFGRVNIPSASNPINITELNIGYGPTAATLPTPLFTQSPTNTQFTLNATSLYNSSVPACASGAFASGSICGLQAVFTPTVQAPETTTYTQAGTAAAGPTPTIVLNGTGAVLTSTSGVVTYTPATPQYGTPVILTATITASSCNTAAPACQPTGTVTFIVNGSNQAPINVTPGSGNTATATLSYPGLTVGPNTVSCTYSGDSYYGGDTCTATTVTVIPATTTSTLLATNNAQPQFNNCVTVNITLPGTNNPQPLLQCGTTVLTADVTAATGTPTGQVSFFVNGQPATNTVDGQNPVALAPSQLSSTGIATLTLAELVFPGSLMEYSNSSLPPGTYTLTCTYTPPAGSNFAPSTCAPVTFTVLPATQAISLYDKACSLNILSASGTQTPTYASACNNTTTLNGNIVVATADGSTTDATVFVAPSPTVSGTLTFSCSGLPQSTTCTFQPSSISVTGSNGYVTPIPFDITFWTDLQPGSVTSLARPSMPAGHGLQKTSFALILGWPFTLLGLAGILRFRRKLSTHRGLSTIAILLLMAGSSLVLTSCAGPGSYTPVLTPAGTYPITVTVTNGSTSASTVIEFKVTSPGIPGQE